MFKNFSKNEKLFILHDFIFLIPLSIVGIFVSFFIWDKSESLTLVSIFHLFSAAGIVCGALISGYLTNKYSSGPLRGIGAILTAIPILILFILGDNSVNYIIPIGLLFGIAVGIRVIPYKLLFTNVLSVQNRENFLNLDNTAYSFVNIVVPLLAALVVGKTGNYSFLFILTAILFIIAAIPVLLLRDPQFATSSYELKNAIKEIKADADLKKIMWAKLLEGIKLGITVSVWSIIILNIVGSLENWGLFNTIFAILATIVTYTVGRKIKFSNSRIFFVITAFFFASAGLFFATNVNLVTYLVFSFVAGICETIFDIGYQSITSKVIDRNIKSSSVTGEVMLLQEIPLFLGRSIPLLLVIFTKPSFQDDLVLKLLIILVSIIPLIMSSILIKVNVAKRSFDPFVNS